MNEIVNIFKTKIGILKEYHGSISEMLQHLQDGDFDIIDEYSAKHDQYIESLKQEDESLKTLISSMAPEISSILSELLAGRLETCPHWAEEVYSAHCRQNELVRKIIGINNQCISLIQKEMEEVQGKLKETSNNTKVINYYASLKGTQTGILLDIRN
ncbi:MAG TPA: hypothetical protein GXX54_04050 [Clostridiales bacterium]|nr:hypothetical protein [Clostridiales bacterium]